MKFFIDGIKNYANFSDRATRQQYWMFYLFYILITIALTLIDMALGLYDPMSAMGLFSTIFTLGLLIPSIAILARRLHDIGRSGWWILLVIIPLIGALVLLIFAVLDSEKGLNKWGESTKYPQPINVTENNTL